MYVGMIETRSLKILLKNFHENYSDLFKKTTPYISSTSTYIEDEIASDLTWDFVQLCCYGTPGSLPAATI